MNSVNTFNKNNFDDGIINLLTKLVDKNRNKLNRLNELKKVLRS